MDSYYQEEPITENGGFSPYMEKGARRAFSRYFLALLLYLLSANVLAFLSEFLLTVFAGADTYMAIVESPYYVWGSQVLFMYIIAFPIFYVVVHGMNVNKRWRKDLSADECMVFFFITMAVTEIGGVLTNIIDSIITFITGMPIVDSTSELILDSPLWIVLLVVVVIGPIVEELLFRKLLIDRLSRYGDLLALIVSSVAFGLFHGNLSQIFYAAMVGFVLGYVYIKTGKTVYNMGLHMIVNFFGSAIPILLLRSSAWMDAYADYTDAEWAELVTENPTIALRMEMTNLASIGYSAFLIALTVAGVILFILRVKSVYIDRSCEVEIPKKKVPKVVLLNLGVILFFLFCLAEIVLDLYMPVIQEYLSSLIA